MAPPTDDTKKSMKPEINTATAETVQTGSDQAVAPSTLCYAFRVLKWAHCGKEGWMSEYATNIEIEDEGAGEFLILTQPFASTKLSAGGIAINPEEWPTLRDAIDAAFLEISQHNSEIGHGEAVDPHR